MSGMFTFHHYLLDMNFVLRCDFMINEQDLIFKSTVNLKLDF